VVISQIKNSIENLRNRLFLPEERIGDLEEGFWKYYIQIVRKNN
jgi:hypothetical protein